MTIPPSREQGNISELTELPEGVRHGEESNEGHPVDVPVDSGSNVLTAIETTHWVAMDSLVPASARPGSAVRFFVSTPGSHPSSSPIGFINQANTSLLECRAEAVHLFTYSGYPIDTVYNPTCSGWSSRHISPTSDTVRLLREGWDNYFNQIREGWDNYFNQNTDLGSLRLQVCAGDGTFVVRAALQGYPHAQRIIVVACAPSCAIDPRLCLRVRHYRVRGDITSLCFGPGSHSPEFSVVSRDPNSRGTMDLAFYSSSFLNLLFIEGLIFMMGRELLLRQSLPPDYDTRSQNLRNQCLQNQEPEPPSCYLRRLRLRPQQYCSIFARGLVGRGISGRPADNLYEEALDEFPRDMCERVGAVLNSLRELLLISSEIVVCTARGGLGSAPAIVGVPILQGVVLLQQSGVYWVRRQQGNESLWRMISLRGSLVEALQNAYNIFVCSQIAFADELPLAARAGFGGYVFMMSSSFVVENMIRFYSPLRGRIQGWLTEVGSSSIETEATQNAEAQRVGLVARVFRGVGGAWGATAVLTAAASVLYPALVSRDPRPQDPTPDPSDSNATDYWGGASGALIGMTGMIATFSLIYNVVQASRMAMRLRRQRQASGIAQQQTSRLIQQQRRIGRRLSRHQETIRVTQRQTLERTEEEESMIELIDFPPTGGIPPENEQQGFLDDPEETDTDV